jgi:hypothetical protein
LALSWVDLTAHSFRTGPSAQVSQVPGNHKPEKETDL